MPVTHPHIPKYRHYKPKNLAVVRIDGRDHYLGKYDSAESHEKYHRLLAEWHANGRIAPVVAKGSEPPGGAITVGELALAYYRHSEQYYVKNGEVTNQVRMIRLALKVANVLYGSVPVGEFGPMALKACRAEFVAQGLSRRECNRRTNLIKQAFRWGTGNELVAPGVYHALLAVDGLRKGRCEAREPEPIGPVPDDIVDRTMAHLNPTVAAMVSIQRLTGMRPQEVVAVRAVDIDTADPTCWVYRPDRHKGEHHEQDRVVFIGPRAIEVIRPFLQLDMTGCLFSPARAEAEHRVGRRAGRKTPLYRSHVAHQAEKRGRRGRRSFKDHYDVASYRRAIARACDRAFPHPTLAELPEKILDDAQRAEIEEWRKAHRWHPHQLRHATGTAIRGRFGLEAAQAVLGHSELSSTQVYAEKNLEAARAVMRQIG